MSTRHRHGTPDKFGSVSAHRRVPAVKKRPLGTILPATPFGAAVSVGRGRRA
ncbi:MAG: hypothetical protein HSCHL_1579 [Hydrogenibacillus schlegelii]|uniref:Uncharacterized protein n=1 Tax=Hydrogenibacillus schlegelii TaxID=1484 RepID=A0A2T5GBT7_HYDSH|nr:MAG: hypothetical protein HSCHL_1579 [Hydrogenibacillus schlegelii]